MVEKFNFKILANRDYPDLNNYTFIFNLNDLNLDVTIKEHFTTGFLFVKVGDSNFYPLRINTNLLPPIYQNEVLIYDYKEQAFLYYKK